MSKYEKLGNFLLFEKFEEDKLSKSFIAGQIVNNQIQQIQIVKKFNHSLTAVPGFVGNLNQEYEVLKALANPNIVRPSAFVQEKSEFAAVFEYVEGKSLRAVLSRCHQDGYPFTADHALLIGSRLCTALEYIHSKKVNDERLVHGFLSPESILVTYDGEIKLQYLNLAQALLKSTAGRDLFFRDYKNYLAPELLTQQKLDKSVDVFGAGLVLYEMLTGEALFAKGREISIPQAIEHAQIFLSSGERSPVPDDFKKILSQCLSMDPAHRFGAVADVRKALDQMLFSSEFAPTTFNLAFFMHSLFRENIEEEGKNVKNFKKIDVTSFLKEEPPPPPKVEHPVGAEAARDIPLNIDRQPQSGFSEPQIFGAVEPREKSKTPLFLGILIGVAVLAGIGYFALRPSSKSPQNATVPGTLTPEQQKSQETERLRYQEEASKAQEEAKSKDVQLKELQAKMDALLKQQQKQQKEDSTAPTVDTAALQQLQEQAKKLEQEKREQEALAQEKLKAAQAPVLSPVQPVSDAGTADTKTQVAQAPPVSQPANTQADPQPAESKPEAANPEPEAAGPAVKEGDTVDMTPDVVKPELVSRVNPDYPSVARARRIEGTVILSVLISERGDVADIKVLRGAGGSSGLNEAASAAVRKWKFRPAVKEGKRVRVWVSYPIVFKLQ